MMNNSVETLHTSHLTLHVTQYYYNTTYYQDTPHHTRKGNAKSREPSGVALHKDGSSGENKGNPSVSDNYVRPSLQSEREKYKERVTPPTSTSTTTRAQFRPPSTLIYGFMPLTTEKTVSSPHQKLIAGKHQIKHSYWKNQSKIKKSSKNSFLKFLNSLKKTFDNLFSG